jgi:hypothetical protein
MSRLYCSDREMIVDPSAASLSLFEVAHLLRFYAEGVTQHSPGQSDSSGRENHAALGHGFSYSSAEDNGNHGIATLPRPKRTAAFAVSATRRLIGESCTRPRMMVFHTQGGAARLRRLALPWAMLFNAFGVRNNAIAQHQGSRFTPKSSDA